MARDSELHIAVKRNNIKEIKQLLSTDENINCLDDEGQTPLYLALHVRSQESAILLLKHGAKYFKSKSNRLKEANILHVAAELGAELVVKWLLENGADANETYGKYYRTPLHRAATGAVVKTLLELGGVNVNGKSDHASRPIHWAVNSNRLDVVKTLLDHGADVNATDDSGETPLHAAAENSNLEMLQLLLDNGADVNARKDDGSNVLHFEDYDRSLDAEIVSEILKHDVDIDAQNGCWGQTPMHRVIIFPEVVKMYLRKGADINIRSCDCERPLDHAIECYNSFKFRYDNYYRHEVGPGEELVPFDEFEDIIDLKCAIDCLVQHETKLKVLGFYIDDELVCDFEGFVFNDLDHNDCELELNRLEVDVCKSIKDILTTRYPRYVLNKDFCDKLATIDVAEYPVYGELILDKMERDKKRMVKLERCQSLFARSELEPTLPRNIWERILSNLKDAELTGILRKPNKRKTSKSITRIAIRPHAKKNEA